MFNFWLNVFAVVFNIGVFFNIAGVFFSHFVKKGGVKLTDNQEVILDLYESITSFAIYESALILLLMYTWKYAECTIMQHTVGVLAEAIAVVILYLGVTALLAYLMYKHIKKKNA